MILIKFIKYITRDDDRSFIMYLEVMDFVENNLAFKNFVAQNRF